MLRETNAKTTTLAPAATSHTGYSYLTTLASLHPAHPTNREEKKEENEGLTRRWVEPTLGHSAECPNT